jgi:putative ABC transport system ATP-binding protein
MIIEAREVCKEYRRGDRPFWAVDNVSLTLDAGEFVCVMGRSGSGKSTLINILAGLLTPTAGRVLFEGEEYAGLDDDRLATLRNTGIGYIMQGYGVLPNFTVLENVLLPHYLQKRTGDPETRAYALLEQTGIGPLAAQYPAQLSGGELRRVSIARALLNAPKLLLADEPTSDLDRTTTAEIMELLAGIAAAGAAVLMVTHEPDALGYSSRSYTMESGRLLAG